MDDDAFFAALLQGSSAGNRQGQAKDTPPADPFADLLPGATVYPAFPPSASAESSTSYTYDGSSLIQDDLGRRRGASASPAQPSAGGSFSPLEGGFDSSPFVASAFDSSSSSTSSDAGRPAAYPQSASSSYTLTGSSVIQDDLGPPRRPKGGIGKEAKGALNQAHLRGPVGNVFPSSASMDAKEQQKPARAPQGESPDDLFPSLGGATNSDTGNSQARHRLQNDASLDDLFPGLSVNSQSQSQSQPQSRAQTSSAAAPFEDPFDLLPGATVYPRQATVSQSRSAGAQEERGTSTGTGAASLRSRSAEGAPEGAGSGRRGRGGSDGYEKGTGSGEGGVPLGSAHLGDSEKLSYMRDNPFPRRPEEGVLFGAAAPRSQETPHTGSRAESGRTQGRDSRRDSGKPSLSFKESGSQESAREREKDGQGRPTPGRAQRQRGVLGSATGRGGSDSSSPAGSQPGSPAKGRASVHKGRNVKEGRETSSPLGRARTNPRGAQGGAGGVSSLGMEGERGFRGAQARDSDEEEGDDVVTGYLDEAHEASSAIRPAIHKSKTAPRARMAPLSASPSASPSAAHAQSLASGSGHMATRDDVPSEPVLARRQTTHGAPHPHASIVRRVSSEARIPPTLEDPSLGAGIPLAQVTSSMSDSAGFTGRPTAHPKYLPPLRFPIPLDRPACFELRPNPARDGGEDEGGKKGVHLLAAAGPLVACAGEDGIRIWNLDHCLSATSPHSHSHSPSHSPSQSQQRDQRGALARSAQGTPEQGGAGLRGSLGGSKKPGAGPGAGGEGSGSGAAPHLHVPLLGGAPITSLCAEDRVGVLLSGHRDGCIRAWKLTALPPGVRNSVRSVCGVDVAPLIEWQAHSGAVLSLVITAHGELWSSAERSGLKAWPWSSLLEEFKRSSTAPLETLFWTQWEDRTPPSPARLSSPRMTRVPDAKVTFFSPKLGAPSSAGSPGAAGGSGGGGGGGGPGSALPDWRHLAADSSQGYVWSASHSSLGLWDTCSRELIRCINLQVDPAQGGSGAGGSGGGDSLGGAVVSPEGLPIGGFAGISGIPGIPGVPGNPKGKEKKPQGGWKFFTKSRDIVVGAVSDVVKAATGADDGRKVTALAVAPDGCALVGLSSGALQRFCPTSGLKQSDTLLPAPVRALTVAGSFAWAALADGSLAVVSTHTGLKEASWPAHKSELAQVVQVQIEAPAPSEGRDGEAGARAGPGGGGGVGGGRPSNANAREEHGKANATIGEVPCSFIATLARHGGVRAWLALPLNPGPKGTSTGTNTGTGSGTGSGSGSNNNSGVLNGGPGYAADEALRNGLLECKAQYTQRRRVRVFGGTWNVGEEKPLEGSVRMWLSDAAREAHVVVVGLQEMEMGAGAIALAAAKETVGMQERFSERAQLWVSAISSALKHKPASPTLGSSTGCGGGSMSSIAGTVGSSIGGSLGHTHSMGGAAGHSSGGSMGHNMSSAAAAAVSGGGVGGGRDGVRGGLQDPSEGGDVSLSSPFEQLAFRQLAGLLICVWVRKDVRAHIGKVETDSVATGFGRTLGNKGGVAVRLRLWSRDVCFVNSHLAAHTDGVPKRNDDWRRIYDGMFSGRASQGPPGAKGEAQPLASVAKAAGATWSSAVSGISGIAKAGRQAVGAGVGAGAGETSQWQSQSQFQSQVTDWGEERDGLPDSAWSPSSGPLPATHVAAPNILSSASSKDPLWTQSKSHKELSSMGRGVGSPPVSGSMDPLAVAPPLGQSGSADVTRSGVGKVDPELSKVDLLVWLGDLNYRLVDLTQEEAKGLIGSRQWGTLLACDQLAGEMAQGRAFAFMREGPLLFPPTYKFDRGTTKPMAYDSGEKRRVPAWCDRVLFRDSFCTTLAPAPAPGAPPVALASLSGISGLSESLPGSDGGHSDVGASARSSASLGTRSASGNSSISSNHNHTLHGHAANNHSSRMNSSSSNRNAESTAAFPDSEPLDRDRDRPGSGYPPLAKEFAVERATTSSAAKLPRKDLPDTGLPPHHNQHQQQQQQQQHYQQQQQPPQSAGRLQSSFREEHTQGSRGRGVWEPLGAELEEREDSGTGRDAEGDAASSPDLCQPVKATVQRYDCCLETVESDHKPVRCLLELEVASVQDGARRAAFANLLRSSQVAQLLSAALPFPDTSLSPARIDLSFSAKSTLHLSNHSSGAPAVFSVFCLGDVGAGKGGVSCACGGHRQGRADGGLAGSAGAKLLRSKEGGTLALRPNAGLPLWLEVSPGCGTVLPGKSVSMHLSFKASALEGDRAQKLKSLVSKQDRVVRMAIVTTGQSGFPRREHHFCLVHQAPWTTMWEAKAVKPAQDKPPPVSTNIIDEGLFFGGYTRS